MPTADRRTFLAGSAALPAVGALPALAADAAARVAVDLQRYVDFGNKQAGGGGDMACGNWLAAELEQCGFKIERQQVSVPYFEPSRVELVTTSDKATLWPQPIVVQTDPAGVTGKIVRVDASGQSDASLQGAIALIDLPFARWSTAIAKPVREPITAAFAAGAKAAVVITNGPSGKVIALNADGRKPMFAGPVALLAPDDARPFLASAHRGESATLYLTGTGGHREAFNFVGRIDRGRGRWLAVSTPRSGWFTCAAERGPGIATWLWLARWASRALTTHDLAFVCNSGHEYEYLGASEALKAIAPAPERTSFWLHLGANLAARDWHEGTGKPLPSVDPQRFLSLSPPLVELARRTFAGLPGFEAPYSTQEIAAGELTEIIAAGYTRAAGVFGIHRYHHVALDDARCLSPQLVAQAAAAFQRLVGQVLAADAGKHPRS